MARILVIQLGRLGDVIQTTPLLGDNAPAYCIPARLDICCRSPRNSGPLPKLRRSKDMKRQIVLALCVSVGIGFALLIPGVNVHSSDKEQRFPLLKVEQLNDQQRPFADEILKVSSIGISGPYN